MEETLIFLCMINAAAVTCSSAPFPVVYSVDIRASNEPSRRLGKVLQSWRRGPYLRAFSWLKGSTGAFTFKTLLRHYAKRAVTPRSLNVKLGPRHKGTGGLVSIVSYSRPSLMIIALRTQFHVERLWGQSLFSIV